MKNTINKLAITLTFCAISIFVFAQKNSYSFRTDFGVGIKKSPYSFYKKFNDRKVINDANISNFGLTRVGFAVEIQFSSKNYSEIWLNTNFYRKQLFVNQYDNSNQIVIGDKVELFSYQYTLLKNFYIKTYNNRLNFYLGTGLGLSYDLFSSERVKGLSNSDFFHRGTLDVAFVPRIKFGLTPKWKLEIFAPYFPFTGGAQETITNDPQKNIRYESVITPVFDVHLPKEIRFGLVYQMNEKTGKRK
jgi:hypothetical protein